MIKKKDLQRDPFLWFGAELNRRHIDFQSIALPTELPNQYVMNIVPSRAIKLLPVGGANVKKYFVSQKNGTFL